MKKFDLELAKKHHPVQTRDGRCVRIICYDRKSDHDLYPIVALVPIEEGREETIYYTKKGVYSENIETSLDLFMAQVKREGWINIYSSKEVGFIFNSEEEAIENASTALELKATIKIEWEE